MGANGNFGLIQRGFCRSCSSIRRTFQIPRVQNGFSPHIITHFRECKRFGWMRGKKGLDESLKKYCDKPEYN